MKLFMRVTSIHYNHSIKSKHHKSVQTMNTMLTALKCFPLSSEIKPIGRIMNRDLF